MVPVERNAGASNSKRIWKYDRCTPMNNAQFKALTTAPKEQRNNIGGRIIFIHAIVNVPKPIISNNGELPLLR
jgi:hypothetical protein